MESSSFKGSNGVGFRSRPKNLLAGFFTFKMGPGFAAGSRSFPVRRATHRKKLNRIDAVWPRTRARTRSKQPFRAASVSLLIAQALVLNEDRSGFAYAHEFFLRIFTT